MVRSMNDIVLGLLALVAGLLFCFRGHLLLRVIIPIWGAFVGFTLGAGIVAAATDEGFLSTALAWFVGFGLAVLFAGIAYLYYAVAVVIAMASIGFSLGASLMVALGVSWTWLIVLAGLAVGVLLAALAIIADMPSVVLVVLSALAGASAATFGLMLLAGTLESDDLTVGEVTRNVDDGWWWYAIYVVLAVIGVVLQARSTEDLRASMRANWEAQRQPAP